MKQDIDNLDQTYSRCITEGRIREKNTVDTELIKSLKEMATKSLKFTRQKTKDLKKDSPNWTFIFRDYYKALRQLIEAFMLFDKTQSENHQCNNAYICTKHPKLELDWEFLETARLKRNAINYKGQPLRYEDWNNFKIKFELHISIITKKIEEKLNTQY